MCAQKSSGSFYLEIDRRANLDKNFCRFGMFVRLRPGVVSMFKDQARTWYFRGDKYTKEDNKMLKNLLNHLKNKIQLYDRIIIYDKAQLLDKKEIVKIVDDTIYENKLNRYHEYLQDYALPVFLR